MDPIKQGSLVCVGTGIKSIGQVTLEARNHIVTADKVYSVCTDPVSENWVRKLNPTTETLCTFYGDQKYRDLTYEQMTMTLVDGVRAGQRVCAVFYGHPGVFVAPTHDAIRILREEGYQATMQPGISAEDNLYADLGIDPARNGCQMYEATHLLVTNRTLDPTATVIIWQVGCVGNAGFNLSGYSGEHVPVLVEFLERTYGPDHKVTVYEAAIFPGNKHRADRIPVHELTDTTLSGISTLYIPPLHAPDVDKDMIRRLKLRQQLDTRPQPTPALV